MTAEITIERIDAAIADFFSSWNIYTTILATVLVAVLAYVLLTNREPDVHPFLLARQSHIAPIRHPGESAVYRAVDVPHGYPLRAGLGVKDPGAPKWSTGRNGDLRDIWRQAVRGPVNEDGSSAGPRGTIVTVLGREKVVEHSLDDVSLQINVIGTYLQQAGLKTVAICLSNSVEFLASIFAGAFYGFSPVLIPYGLPQDQFNTLLGEAHADALIAEAGTIDLDHALSADKKLGHVIWVAKGGNKHMDWNDGTPAGVIAATWHDLVEKNKSTISSEVPALDKDSPVLPISTFYVKDGGVFELVEYTSANIISGVAGLSTSIARTHKLTPSDTVLPTSSLTDSYTLCWVLAALYHNATVALNSVAGDKVDLTLATAGVHPTIIIASPATIMSYLSTNSSPPLTRYFATRTLQAGNMPTQRLTPDNATLSNLRVVLISQPATDAPRLLSLMLTDLRILLGARVAYALTAPRVAGALAQTHILDYRDKGSAVCVGAPLGSVEVHLTGEEEAMASQAPRGKIHVKGPAVSGGQVTLEAEAQVDHDYTLLLV